MYHRSIRWVLNGGQVQSDGVLLWLFVPDPGYVLILNTCLVNPRGIPVCEGFTRSLRRLCSIYQVPRTFREYKVSVIHVCRQYRRPGSVISMLDPQNLYALFMLRFGKGPSIAVRRRPNLSILNGITEKSLVSMLRNRIQYQKSMRYVY